MLGLALKDEIYSWHSEHPFLGALCSSYFNMIHFLSILSESVFVISAFISINVCEAQAG